MNRPPPTSRRTALDLSFFLVGAVGYDGLSGTPWWNHRPADLGLNRSNVVVGTVGLPALVVFPKRHAFRSQYAMLMLMVLLTGLGLAILATG